MHTLLLIDAHALLYRFFYGLPPLSTPEGVPTQAIYGLSRTLIKMLSELQPTFAAAAFDRPEATFRKKEFDEYKAHRTKASDELIVQFAEARKTFAAFGMPVFEKPGYEADDILGTLAQTLGAHADLHIVILSGDLDILQLVRGEKTVAHIIKTGVSHIARYAEKEVIERYGLPPTTLPDYKGLVGDASDNIKGVPGIGPKTARELLQEFKTLDGIFENLPIIKRTVAEKLAAHKADAIRSKRLATIVCDVPLETASLEELRIPSFSLKRVTPYLEKLGFQSLITAPPEQAR